MAFVHVQTAQQWPTVATTLNGTTSIPETFAATPTIGNLVIVWIAHFNTTADELSTVTDNQAPHNTWTILASRPRAGTGANGAIAWAVITTASGTFTVTANFAVTSDACIGISEFSGNAVAASVTNGNGSTIGTDLVPTSTNLTPTQANDLFVSLITDDDSAQTYTTPGSWSLRAKNQAGTASMVLASASLITSDSLAHQAVWGSTTLAHWCCIIAAFKANTNLATQFTANIIGQGNVTASGLTFPGVLDFGDSGGSNEASLKITGQSGILSGTQVEAWLQAEAANSVTSALDVTYASRLIQLTCGDIIPGVGFTIFAKAPEKIQGRYLARWVWV